MAVDVGETKETFFAQFDAMLAQSYGMTPSQIRAIRTLHLGMKMPREDIAEWCRFILKMIRFHGTRHQSRFGRRNRSKAYYERILQFLSEASNNAWTDVVHKTHWDTHELDYE